MTRAAFIADFTRQLILAHYHMFGPQLRGQWWNKSIAEEAARIATDTADVLGLIDARPADTARLP